MAHKNNAFKKMNTLCPYIQLCDKSNLKKIIAPQIAEGFVGQCTLKQSWANCGLPAVL